MGKLKVDAAPLIYALRLIVSWHDRDASEMEPGFICGCSVCNEAKKALEESGANDNTTKSGTSR